MPMTTSPVRQSVVAISHTISGTRTPPMPEPAIVMDSARDRCATNQLATVVVTTRNVPNESPSVSTRKAA